MSVRKRETNFNRKLCKWSWNHCQNTHTHIDHIVNVALATICALHSACPMHTHTHIYARECEYIKSGQAKRNYFKKTAKKALYDNLLVIWMLLAFIRRSVSASPLCGDNYTREQFAHEEHTQFTRHCAPENETKRNEKKWMKLLFIPWGHVVRTLSPESSPSSSNTHTHTQRNGTTYVREMIGAAMSWRDIITSIDRIEEQKRKRRQQEKMPLTKNFASKCNRWPDQCRSLPIKIHCNYAANEQSNKRIHTHTFAFPLRSHASCRLSQRATCESAEPAFTYYATQSRACLWMSVCVCAVQQQRSNYQQCAHFGNYTLLAKANIKFSPAYVFFSSSISFALPSTVCSSLLRFIFIIIIISVLCSQRRRARVCIFELQDMSASKHRRTDEMIMRTNNNNDRKRWNTEDFLFSLSLLPLIFNVRTKNHCFVCFALHFLFFVIVCGFMRSSVRTRPIFRFAFSPVFYFINTFNLK